MKTLITILLAGVLSHVVTVSATQPPHNHGNHQAGAVVDSSSSSGSDATATQGQSSSARLVNESVRVSSAASVVPQSCQNGMSGQGEDAGFGMTSPDPICMYYNAAEANRKAYWEARARIICPHIRCEVNCPLNGYVEAELMTCPENDITTRYLSLYHENLRRAQDLVDESAIGAHVDQQVSLWQRTVAWLIILGLVL